MPPSMDLPNARAHGCVHPRGRRRSRPGRSPAETWCRAAELDTLTNGSELTEWGELAARAEQLAS